MLDVLDLFNMLPSLLAKGGAFLVTGRILAEVIKYKRTILKTPTNRIRPKKTFNKIIEDRGLMNGDIKANVCSIKEFTWGYRVIIDIAGVMDYKDIERELGYIKTMFRAEGITSRYAEGMAIIDICYTMQELEYSKVELSPTKLLLGYNNKGENIIVDMLKTPHIGIQGASNSGKSKGVELALNNIKDKVDIILLNTFESDFKSLTEARRINGNENILKYLKSIIDEPYRRNRPLYLVLDELNVIGKDKEINKAIQDVLSQARHYNIYLVALGQSLLKENCPYKQLFNVRVTFRAIDKSTISAFLGCNIEDTELRQQEFICYAEELQRGKTYNFSF